MTSLAGTAYTYDKAGNVASAGSKAFSWNYRDRLLQVATGTATTTHGYDHNNQRTRMTVLGVGTTTYAGMYFDKLASTTGATSTSYIFAGDTLVATVVGNGSATSTYYSHQDHLGSTNVTTNASGTVTQTLDYYPYGSTRVDSGTDVSSREFIGQMFDETSNLSYLNARYYDGDKGRFTSQDPVHLAIGNSAGLQNLSGRGQQYFLSDPQQLNSGRTMGGLNSGFASGWNGNMQSRGNSISQAEWLADPQAQNSYGYARNNPLKYKDPDGKYIELSGSLVVPGRTFSLGLLFDGNGIDGYMGGGFGAGLSGGVNIAWAPGVPLSHQREANITANGTAAYYVGGRLSQDLLTYYPDTRTSTRFNRPELAVTLGMGLSGSVEQQLSKPLYVWGSGNSSVQSANGGGGSSLGGILNSLSSALKSLSNALSKLKK